MSRTEIHIERLVLDGLDFGAADVGTLRAALELDLGRAFARDGAREPAAAAPGSPAGLGREAAQAIHRSVVGRAR